MAARAQLRGKATPLAKLLRSGRLERRMLPIVDPHLQQAFRKKRKEKKIAGEVFFVYGHKLKWEIPTELDPQDLLSSKSRPISLLL